MILEFYKHCMRLGTPLIKATLNKRQKRGKESLERLPERQGVAHKERPDGPLIWVHAASVGEAQSALIVINTLLERTPGAYVMVTTGTLTSAAMMEKNLPARAFHQFYPVDHPDWVERFLNHWRPDLILWMESELWPNMLMSIQGHDIPTLLINARLSPQSYKHWRLFKKSARKILKSFSLILCQNDTHAEYFKTLGAQNVQVTDNIKYNAAALPCDEDDLQNLNTAIDDRPCWVYASTHAGEEALAARIHKALSERLPNLLTIIVPRHPERRDDIQTQLHATGLNVLFRGDEKAPPTNKTDIYIADTMGELGLFYRACPVAVIGRSFSDDGGGGHNPIEAAQLHCAVLHGPHVQNLQDIFDEMNEAGAALTAQNEDELLGLIENLLSDKTALQKQQKKAYNFAQEKQNVLERVLKALDPYFKRLGQG